MSSYRRNNRNSCKVCRDAGKDYEEYSSHSVKDRTGKTICPTLLAQKCRCCGKNGHTAKFCTFTGEKRNFTGEKSETEEFPALSRATEKKAPENKTSYASVLSKEPELPRITRDTVVNESYTVIKTLQRELKPAKIRRIITSWADDYSSDEEE